MEPKPVRDDCGSAPAYLRVLSSGSGGNCSVLLPQRSPDAGFWLIDAGLSPRRTKKLLEHASLTLECLRGIIVTHLDSDHWNPVWQEKLAGRADILIHESHIEPGQRAGLVGGGARPYSGSFDLADGVRICSALAAHDETGSATMRIEFKREGQTATLGFATDVGRADSAFVGHLRDVDVLAIESNYCPRLQAASGRPWFLRQRITSGSGHLSNQECAAAVRAIRPRSHVVLLHLSRQCNRPDLALAEHRGAGYQITVTSQHQATGWIPIAPGAASRIPDVDAPLFAEIAARAVAAGAP
jgi:phosphoribosyl 1,2-cyclic phosphodiesterase